ncbi:MAG: hypothetical protein ACE5GR_02335 [Nitrosopumilus sp.]
MDKKLRKASLLVILPLVLTAFSLGFMVEADAVKAKGSDGTQSPKSYGGANDDVVCGDKLCSEIKENSNSNLST